MGIILAIFLGGGLGSVTRYLLSKSITSNFTDINPLGTLVTNLVSTLLLGLILFMSGSRLQVTGITKALLVAGFCGGFSTFSTFSYETFELLRTGNWLFAAGNMVFSIILGVGVLFLLARTL